MAVLWSVERLDVQFSSAIILDYRLLDCCRINFCFAIFTLFVKYLALLICCYLPNSTTLMRSLRFKYTPFFFPTYFKDDWWIFNVCNLPICFLFWLEYQTDINNTLITCVHQHAMMIYDKWQKNLRKFSIQSSTRTVISIEGGLWRGASDQ